MRSSTIIVMCCVLGTVCAMALVWSLYFYSATNDSEWILPMIITGLGVFFNFGTVVSYYVNK